MKKKLSFIILTALSLSLLTGCGNIDSKEILNVDKSTNSKFTESEEATFHKEFSEQVLDLAPVIDLTKKLDENIAKLSKKGATMAVDGVLHVTTGNFEKLQLSQASLDKINQLNEQGVDLNKLEDIDKLEDLDFQKFIKEVYL